MKKSNVTLMRQRMPASDKTLGGGHTGGGNPPGGDDMERRIKVLEDAIPETRERLVRIEARMDHMATKADLEALRSSISTDLYKAINDQTWKFIGVATALAGLAFVAARFLPGTGG